LEGAEEESRRHRQQVPGRIEDFSRNGPIGLQGLHGKAQAPVWYRNVRIRELK